MQRARRGILACAITSLLGIPGAASGGPEAPEIHSVTTDRQLEVLTIRGAHLKGAAEPHVRLRGYPAELEKLSADDSVIRARLPARIAPGGYLLTVSNGSARQVKLLLHTPAPVVRTSRK